jgi:hypothetical protein
MGKSDNLSFTRPTDPFIRFYDCRFKESYFLSNFFPCPLNIELPSGKDSQKELVEFFCSEGLYHAKRAPGFPWREFKDLTGPQAWKKAQSLKKDTPFAPEKFEIMLDVVRSKFHNPSLKEKLLETQAAYLVERTKDPYWGDQLDGTGSNNLGKICMIVRGELGGYGVTDRPREYEEFVKVNLKKP